MRNKTVSRITMASFLGIGVVALAFACDDTTPTPTPVDMATIPDMTLPPDLMPATPTVTAITPAMGPAAGGTSITITGTNSTNTFSGTLTDSTGVVGVETGIPGFNNGFVTTVGSGRIILDLDTDHNGTVAVPSGSMTFNSNIAYAGTLELKSGTLFLPGVHLTVGTLNQSWSEDVAEGSVVSASVQPGTSVARRETGSSPPWMAGRHGTLSCSACQRPSFRQVCCAQ